MIWTVIFGSKIIIQSLAKHKNLCNISLKKIVKETFHLIINHRHYRHFPVLLFQLPAPLVANTKSESHGCLLPSKQLRTPMNLKDHLASARWDVADAPFPNKNLPSWSWRKSSQYVVKYGIASIVWVLDAPKNYQATVGFGVRWATKEIPLLSMVKLVV